MSCRGARGKKNQNFLIFFFFKIYKKNIFLKKCVFFYIPSPQPFLYSLPYYTRFKLRCILTTHHLLHGSIEVCMQAIYAGSALFTDVLANHLEYLLQAFIILE